MSIYSLSAYTENERCQQLNSTTLQQTAVVVDLKIDRAFKRYVAFSRGEVCYSTKHPVLQVYATMQTQICKQIALNNPHKKAHYYSRRGHTVSCLRAHTATHRTNRKMI